MKNLLTLSLLAVGCAADEPALGTAESELGSSQGESWQGESWQGESWQGESWQGESWQGESWQGTEYDGSSWTGTSLSGVTRTGIPGTMSVTITNTVVHLWRLVGNTWEERTPDQICTWNFFRTSKTCTTIDLNVSPSPLAGTEFRGTFRKLGQNNQPITFIGIVRIGRSITDLTAVTKDLSTKAMYALDGHSSTSACTLETCENPAGCRKNCDLWKYDVRVVSVLDSHDEPQEICESATALAGTWNASGTWVNSGNYFTFACAGGVIAKCLRWGYRPFGSARRVNETSLTPLAPYHQACVRAATADYCGIGHSFTKNGTLVDFWDGGGETGPGQNDPFFVPRTRTLFPDSTAYVFEAFFTPGGAMKIDHFRYQEESNIEEPGVGCPGKFIAAGEDDVLSCYDEHATDCMFSDTGYNTSGPYISVDSSTGCAHSELTVGKALHGSCSGCTASARIPLYCTDPTDPRGWNATCVAAAQSFCTTTNRMAIHGECTTGAALSLRDTGCTARLCQSKPGCCSGNWDATCVKQANEQCRGGQERISRFPGNSLGFCGTAL